MAAPTRDDHTSKNHLDGSVHPDPEQQEAIVEDQFPSSGKGRGSKGKRGRRGRPKTANVGEWMSQINLCERAYEKNLNQVRSSIKRFKNVKPGGTRITVPLLTPLVEIKSAMATFRNPYISVRPRKRVSPTTPHEVLAAAVKEVYVNWVWAELDMKSETRRVVKDALLAGRGITMPGYNAIVDPDGTVEYDSVIADRVSPFDYMLDIEADSSRNAWYGIRRMIMPIPVAERQFNKSGVFTPSVVTRNHRGTQGGDNQLRKNAIKAYGRTVVYEIQDLLNNQFLYCTPGYSKWLLKFDNPFGTEGLLPEFLEPMPVPDEINCVAEASLIAVQLDELSRLRTYWMEHWKKLIPKYITPVNFMTEDMKQLFVGAESATVVEVQGNPQDLKLADVPSLPADVAIHEANIKQDIRDVTGFNEMMQGSKVPGTKTAYETSEIVAGANIRTADLNDFVEQHCSKLSRKMLMIAAKFVGVEDMQLISGLPADLTQIGLPPGFELTDDIMKMETEVTVHTGSMQQQSKETDMRRAMLLQQFLAYPESNRYGILQKMAQLLDENPQEILLPPEVIDKQKQEEARQAAMEGGGGRAAAGNRTGSIQGSRPRTDKMNPGG